MWNSTVASYGSEATVVVVFLEVWDTHIQGFNDSMVQRR